MAGRKKQESDIMKKDLVLIGWCLFCGLVFNVLMSRGCDTFLWFMVVQIASVCIILFPFLPNSLLNVFIEGVEYNE